ncbi:MAG: cyclic nucleotide-binding domain-containing protein [Thermoleophilia bacterium]|nr:cyclic nucleotide-binding domain-containing protein [Thermoleophilia bacterium]
MDGIRDGDDPAGVGAGNRRPATPADDAAMARATRCFTFLRSVPILFEIDDTALWEIALSAEEREFDPGARIVTQGDRTPESDHGFYVIRSGSADVLRQDRSGGERVVARLSVGSYFGELGLLTNQSRNATVRVHGSLPLQAYAFDALTFHSRIAEHVLVFRILRDRERRLSRGRTDGRGRLRIKELDLLRRLPGPDLEFILDHAEHRWFPERSSIIQQGDPGDRFYILLEGSVRVVRDGDVVAELGPGDFFGETALLLDMPRNATVQVDRHALTWSITRAAFQRLVGGYLLGNPQTQHEILRRMRTVLPPEDRG